MARKKTSAREIIAETREEIVDEMLRKMEAGGLSWINESHKNSPSSARGGMNCDETRTIKKPAR